MHPTRQLLLDHGLDIVRSKGLRGLTVRELAAAANVNLGSFVYHFGNRSQFLDELVELWYAPIYAQLQDLARPDPGHSAFERLTHTLQELLRWLLSNNAVVSHLLADALAGEPSARAFAIRLPSRHPKLLLRLIREAQAEGTLVAGPPIALMAFIATSTALPLLLMGAPEGGADWLPAMKRIRQTLISPVAVQRRLQWALRGVSADRQAHVSMTTPI